MVPENVTLGRGVFGSLSLLLHSEIAPGQRLYNVEVKFHTVWPQSSTLQDFINKFLESTPDNRSPVSRTEFLDISENFNNTEGENETEFRSGCKILSVDLIIRKFYHPGKNRKAKNADI